MHKSSLAALALGGLALTAHAQTKWDFATAYPTTNFHTENLTRFAKEAEEAAGGKLAIAVHPNASLFKAPEIKRAVQGNQAQVGEILLSAYQNEWQVFGLDGLPFLASSYGEARKLYRAQKPVLEKKLGEQGMMLLYAVPWQPQGLYSRKPLNTLTDLKGSKWRAYNPATSRIAELIGAQPVTVQAAELSQALATGVVDSFMTSSATGYDSKTYEHIKYYYNAQAWLPKNAVIVNKKAFEGLDKAAQDGVLKAAAAAEERGWKMSEAKDREYQGLLRKNGMEIAEPSPQMKTDLRKLVGTTMLNEWVEKAGPEGKAIVEAYQKM
ncbi:TRAP transporter substrate-binding protein [Schlegelella sp. S2-27]|uniref:TRAP transporter substrate-binding protein n=1 Tax=Caldimonas mangrovi TaxID=2944811 RepID=A0ABT0YKP8_9BURK|nr:TRAP transporter substrate-binding protein [Caldimonas mangrovi]MCM5679310.1 TRAP transporter substrate-binding protein [Caldimonas mangrovi]